MMRLEPTRTLYKAVMISICVTLSISLSYGSVIWLTLGNLSNPALNSDGEVLTEADLAGLKFEVFDENLLRLADIDVAGLDRIDDGHYRGVIHLSEPATGMVSIRVFNPENTQYSELGIGLVSDDDFSPFVDINAHSINVSTIPWRDAVFYNLSVDKNGFGVVSNVNGAYLNDSRVAVAATAANRFEFIGWLGDVDPADKLSSTVDVIMDQHRTITGSFGRIVERQWLTTHFGTESIDLEADPDGDDLSTRMEFEAGTDPRQGDQEQTVSIALASGWNLISIPVQPPPKTGFQTILDDMHSGGQWYWDAWERRMISNPTLFAKRGYWVYMWAPDQEVNITGQPVIAHSIFLFKGWNLIGPATARTVTGQSGISATIWAWDQENKRFTAVDGNEALQPNRGYWLYSDSDSEI